MGVDLAGSRVLVTGASSGIGAVTAVALAEQGATVGLVARRADRLDEVLARCREHTPASQRWAADLSDLEQASRIADVAWDAFDGLDVVVNNAAIPKRRHVFDLTLADLETVMRTNFYSPALLTLQLLPRLIKQGRGIVVNVSSLAGRVGVPTEAAYCASKSALCGWSEALAIDLAGTGVEVRLVNPGAIETEIWDQPDNDPPIYDGPKEPPEVVSDAIFEAITGDRFEYYAPDLKAVVEMKTSDPNTFLAGAVAMRDEARAIGEPEPLSPEAADVRAAGSEVRR